MKKFNSPPVDAQRETQLIPEITFSSLAGMGGVTLYKGYKISGESSPSYMEGCHSLGTVYENGVGGSIVEVARIEGKIFKTMMEAEAHGLELARQWVDKRWVQL